MNNIKNILIVLVTIWQIQFAQAYPEFIGFGYSNCITCHYNGSGNGSLNDYGRALFAAEIAAKPPWARSVDDEILGEQSGLLGATPLPYWLRPSFKYRGLKLDSNLNTAKKQSKNYEMQKDLNLVLLFDQDAKYILSLNWGAVSQEAAALPIRHFNAPLVISRENFFRAQITNKIFAYFGFMDKVFGIKHADHTSFNRGVVGLGQNNQAHGVLMQFSAEESEYFLHLYSGDLRHQPSEQIKGGSFLFETNFQEKQRWGFSLLNEANNINKRSLSSIFAKLGIGEGHSFLVESGIEDNLSSNIKAMYAFSQGTIKITRGLFLQSIGQYFKTDISGVSPETIRWGLGFLYFPMQRAELRFQILQNKFLLPTAVSEDTLATMLQVHFSL